MKGRNVLLLSVAVVALGLFVLPQTMSMFTGQHHWYSVKNPGDMEELCAKCHQPEVNEWNTNLAAGGAHATFDENYGEYSGCTICHQINETILTDYAINTSTLTGYNFEDFTQEGLTNTSAASDFTNAWRNQTTPHAAIKVDCQDCHYNATVQLSNPDSAHSDFYNQSSGAATDSAACIGCHTHTNINITWYKYGGLDINATINTTTEEWDIEVTTNTTLVQGNTS
ncbi:hypothetical protein B6V01_001645 [Methanosarcinales archaeon ex4572_44]|nr:MAG: hypothetical protein B6U67_01465 [Methanosarcinales archaeon ex4484_138]PHP45921.1 MAG: hypothetical protein B6V01_001645 [Methanosarcinales archaeon ex4572_44]